MFILEEFLLVGGEDWEEWTESITQVYEYQLPSPLSQKPGMETPGNGKDLKALSTARTLDLVVN